MAHMIRVTPPPSDPRQTRIIGNVAYTAAGAAYLDVPDNVAAVLGAAGWGKMLAVGSTADRPTGARYFGPPGTPYLDTDLSAVIVWNGKAWLDPATGAAV